MRAFYLSLVTVFLMSSFSTMFAKEPASKYIAESWEKYVERITEWYANNSSEGQDYKGTIVTRDDYAAKRDENVKLSEALKKRKEKYETDLKLAQGKLSKVDKLGETAVQDLKMIEKNKDYTLAQRKVSALETEYKGLLDEKGNECGNVLWITVGGSRCEATKKKIEQFHIRQNSNNEVISGFEDKVKEQKEKLANLEDESKDLQGELEEEFGTGTERRLLLQKMGNNINKFDGLVKTNDKNSKHYEGKLAGYKALADLRAAKGSAKDLFGEVSDTEDKLEFLLMKADKVQSDLKMDDLQTKFFKAEMKNDFEKSMLGKLVKDQIARANGEILTNFCDIQKQCELKKSSTLDKIINETRKNYILKEDEIDKKYKEDNKSSIEAIMN